MNALVSQPKPRTNAPRFSWTKARLARALKMRAEGKRAEDIAQALGTKAHNVHRQFHLLRKAGREVPDYTGGFQGERKHTPWTPERDADLMRRYRDGETWEQIAQHFVTTRHAVLKRLTRLRQYHPDLPRRKEEQIKEARQRKEQRTSEPKVTIRRTKMAQAITADYTWNRARQKAPPNDLSKRRADFYISNPRLPIRSDREAMALWVNHALEVSGIKAVSARDLFRGVVRGDSTMALEGFAADNGLNWDGAVRFFRYLTWPIQNHVGVLTTEGMAYMMADLNERVF